MGNGLVSIVLADLSKRVSFMYLHSAELNCKGLWRVISVKIMFVLMFGIYTSIKMSAVTVMRWHVELKRDITEYVLTLRRLE